MKQIFISFLFVLTISSCVTRKTCRRKDAAGTAITSKELLKTLITYKDTTILIKIKGDTTSDTIILKNGLNRLSTPLAISIVDFKNGILKHRLIQKDTLIPTLLHHGLKNSITLIQKEKSQINENVSKGLSFIEKFFFTIGIISLVIVLIKIIIYFNKR